MVVHVTDVSEEGVGVRIAAPPVDGAANTELVRDASAQSGTLDNTPKNNRQKGQVLCEYFMGAICVLYRAINLVPDEHRCRNTLWSGEEKGKRPTMI